MEILIAGCLVVLTALVHAAGFSALIRILIRSRILTKSGFPLATALVIGVTCWLILLHSAEICLWGFFYWWRGSFPDAESAFYFSGVTYTTLGYGDLVLPKPSRMLAPLEALTGTLVYGLSTGLFFAIASQWIGNWTRRLSVPESDATNPPNT
ncbi:potassium channel family protein [Rhodoblastus sp. 17X3]|uniref:potassium channel family protein n=1 Tax=Rhodoblastus sp. 17X3 TaxID=3047026 RepID=UPI0024B774C4|nr:potassium channel family protein [Rhodoblastus sp. 17X3]MDI9849893.1 potassium channel family protein [Rhodoblastus sp. 17X3]